MRNKRWFQAGPVITLLVALTLIAGTALADGPTGAKGGTDGGWVPALNPDDMMEGFEDITNLPDWYMQNNSDPLGVTDWFQGNDGVFPAQAGPATSYIGANYNNTTGGTGTISNWLLTPVLSLSDGDTFSFRTRGPSDSTFADRLEVRLSTNMTSTNVGAAATDVGDFTTLLVSVNPNQVSDGYPQVWTEITVTLDSVGAIPVDGRIGLRYFVTDAGPSGVNSNYIGIDTFSYTDFVPTGVNLSSFGVEESTALLPLWIAAAFAAVLGAGLLIRRRATNKA